jgi:hypothetical protein
MFFVTPDGDRLLLRRLHGPPMRDSRLEAFSGKDVVVAGQRRARGFQANTLRLAEFNGGKPPAEKVHPSSSRGKRR